MGTRKLRRPFSSNRQKFTQNIVQNEKGLLVNWVKIQLFPISETDNMTQLLENKMYATDCINVPEFSRLVESFLAIAFRGMQMFESGFTGFTIVPSISLRTIIIRSVTGNAISANLTNHSYYTLFFFSVFSFN